jgi:BirA family biotin operon repressor/biotin-[acetyl-CoA-carboxylase] ligase
MLLESEVADNAAIDFVVIGVGVNLASKPGDVEYPATSLSEEGFPGIAPEQLLQSYVRRFDFWVRIWRTEGFASIREAWLARAAGLGTDIRVRLERTTLFGRFLDLDDDGALVIQTAEGRRRVAAGDVFPAVG